MRHSSLISAGEIAFGLARTEGAEFSSYGLAAGLLHIPANGIARLRSGGTRPTAPTRLSRALDPAPYR